MDEKSRIGLVIGRFQPFHNGHVYLIKKALTLSEFVVIGVGSSNVKNEENPFSYEERRLMIEKFLKEEKILNVVAIISIPDIPSDELWREYVLSKVKKVDVVIGNNEMGVNSIFERVGMKVMRVGHYKRERLEGTRIRNLMKKKKKWEDRVPEYLIDEIKRLLNKDEQRAVKPSARKTS